MGFYSNIAPTNKTYFNFDKVYPNRYLMEQQATSDGVFLGHYILIKYDLETQKNDYAQENIYPNDEAGDKTTYEINYLIDKNQYQITSRPYDATVWQKVYVDNSEQYAMVAELNSVVPSLHLIVDRPTEDKPQTPYFSGESNNIDYQLHWQPQWGFKIGTVSFNENGFDKNHANAEVLNPNDRIYFTKEKSGTQYPVYARDPVTHTKYIAYNDTADDIQVLNIELPSIGNMISKGYDIIYGKNRDNNPGESLKGYLDFFTTGIQENEIPIQSLNGSLVGATVVGDSWIDTHANALNKEIIIQHKNACPVSDIISTINLNDDIMNSTINLYTPQTDIKGHMVGKTITTVTLPYSFKYITTNGVGTNIDINTDKMPVMTNINANKAQDSLAINSNDQWIRINTDNSNNSITFAHAINLIDDQNTITTDLNKIDGDNSFIVRDMVYDAAGHIIQNKKHIYTLPYNFNKIISGPSSTSTNAVASNTVIINADSAKDALVIEAGNKWLTTAGNNKTNTFIMGHALASIDVKDKKDTVLDEIGYFTVQDFTFDDAGHISGSQMHKYTLPNSIRNIAINGSNAFSATSYNSTLNIKNQNQWINLIVDNGTINIGHGDVGEAKITVGDTDNINLTFGKSFNMPHFKYDEKGHIVSHGTRAVTLPKIKLITEPDVTNTTSTILTDIKLIEDNSDTIKATTKNIGELLLTGYTARTSVTGDISAAESLNDAIGKLEYYQKAEITRAIDADAANATAIQNEIAARSEAMANVVKTDTKFTYTPSMINEDGTVIEAVEMTVELLMNKVRQLENRISELEKK